jgi:hypothetical protein
MALFTLPPTIADKAKYGEWGKGQVDDASVQGPGGPFAQLLGSPGTDRTLRPCRRYPRGEQEKQEYEE